MTITDHPSTDTPAWDFYGFTADLTPAEHDALSRVRAFMEADVRPIVNDYWDRAEFPRHLVAPLAATGMLAFGDPEHSPFPTSSVFRGLANLELARVDAGLSTFYGVHAGLAMGSIRLLGSDAQRAEWLPAMARGERVGAFGLTEPEHGSDVARGLATVARREGDTWVINGAKRWIGNATWGDVVVTWAKDEADGQVKGFLVRSDTPGFHASKIDYKYSQRTVQNADIVYDEARIPESDRLPAAQSFANTSRILTRTRLDVAWSAAGLAVGAYEAALEYATTRRQFGKPIGGYQLVQDLLVRSMANISASVGMCVRVAQLADQGRSTDRHSAMAKLFVTSRTREVVAWCREIFGGNGIDLNYDIIRYFNDSEAMYSFEGTREMNTLIVGRYLTGISAFV